MSNHSLYYIPETKYNFVYQLYLKKLKQTNKKTVCFTRWGLMIPFQLSYSNPEGGPRKESVGGGRKGDPQLLQWTIRGKKV